MWFKLKLIDIFYWSLSIGQLLVILILGWYNDRLIEILFSLILFFVFSSLYTKRFHASRLIACSIISIIVYSIMSRIMPSFHMSILLNVLLTYFLTTMSYYIKDYIDLKKEIKLDNVPIKIEDITIPIIAKANPDLESNDCLAIYAFLHRDRHTTAESIAMKHHMSRSTLYRLVDKTLKKLNATNN